jgi:hypothetical protein
MIDLEVQWTDAPPRTGRVPLWELAVDETKRRLRSPIVLAGAALSALVLSLRPENSPGEAYGSLAGAGLLPLAAATMLAAVLAASRDERSGGEELLTSTPAPPRTRPAAHLLALGGPVLLGVALVVVARLLIGDGLPVAYPQGIVPSTPSIGELANGPVAVLGLGTLGVALARWRNGWIAAPFLLVVLGAWQVFGVYWQDEGAFQWFGVLPDPAQVVTYGSSFGGYPIVSHFDVWGAVWHSVFVVGMSGVAAWVALTRFGDRRSLRWLLAVSAAVALVGGVVQVP